MKSKFSTLFCSLWLESRFDVPFLCTLNANLIKQPTRRKRKRGRQKESAAGFLSLLCFAFPLISQNAERERKQQAHRQKLPRRPRRAAVAYFIHTIFASAINSDAYK
jgi:hypothetical protein